MLLPGQHKLSITFDAVNHPMACQLPCTWTTGAALETQSLSWAQTLSRWSWLPGRCLVWSGGEQLWAAALSLEWRWVWWNRTLLTSASQSSLTHITHGAGWKWKRGRLMRWSHGGRLEVTLSVLCWDVWNVLSYGSFFWKGLIMVPWVMHTPHICCIAQDKRVLYSRHDIDVVPMALPSWWNPSLLLKETGWMAAVHRQYPKWLK